jgi:ribose-phosphate pyrophosphokinase
VSLIFNLPEDETFAYELARGLNGQQGTLKWHEFPDGETSVRVMTPIKTQDVYFVTNLHHPNEKIIKLIFAAEALRAVGAKSITLIAPYLAYMRLDEIKSPGEGLTSRYFAQFISHYYDRLITIDPHLHRYRNLADLYTIKADVVHAAPAIANWVWRHVDKPLIIGPDEESEQWIKEIAREAKLPYLIFKKKRYGDNTVSISAPLMAEYRDHTPVMIDDIISTGSTMIQGVKALQSSGMKKPICIGVHAVFAEGAKENLLAAGAADIVTCNTIAHSTNAIDLSPLIVGMLQQEDKFEE